MMKSDRRYKGQLIRPCVYTEKGEDSVHRGRWVVQTYHQATGVPYSDEACPHHQTLAGARAAIREDVAAAQTSFVDDVLFRCKCCGSGVLMVRIGASGAGTCTDCDKTFQLGQAVSASD